MATKDTGGSSKDKSAQTLNTAQLGMRLVAHNSATNHTHHQQSPLPRTTQTAAPEQSCHILIINSKGGCGKTTISTNLACWLQEHAGSTSIIDYDNQASALDWQHSRRNHNAEPQVVDGVKINKGVTRSWQLRATFDCAFVVMDAPAGISKDALAQLLTKADVILIPVLPSPIDVRASTRFVSQVLLHPSVRGSKKRIGVIANRIRKNTLAYGNLQSFLNSLKIPIVAELKDSQGYLHANATGKALFEMRGKYTKEAQKWHEVGTWVQRTRFRRTPLTSV